MMRYPLCLILALGSALAADWSAPGDVLHELKPCVTYRARFEGDLLVIRAELQPGWHTFAIDNEQRAAVKLAGKRSLGIDQPTRIVLPDGLETRGPWYQYEPKDFSKPDLRWFSWGFEKEAVFAARVAGNVAKPAQIRIRGQACTESTCKNVDISLTVPSSARVSDHTELDLTGLIVAK